MPTAIWGESEPISDEAYPLTLLRQLVAQMMEQFSAQGACLALYDEHIRQMVVRLHLRMPAVPAPVAGADIDEIETVPLGRRKAPGVPASPGFGTGRMRRLTRPLTGLESLATTSPAALFPLGESYAQGQGLIGITWRRNEPFFFRREEVAALPTSDVLLNERDGSGDQRDQANQGYAQPTWFLAAPILEPVTLSEAQTRTPVPRTRQTLGVIVLYQTTPAPGFNTKSLSEIVLAAERIGLYIQNDRLRRAREQTNVYIQRLKEISGAFPSQVALSRLVDEVHRFIKAIVPDVESILLTFYDRDTGKIYDVFAVDHGTRISSLDEHPRIFDPDDRPVWWNITQKEQRQVLLSTDQMEADQFAPYDELLHGTWGDQTSAQSFLLLPMMMFTRVAGSLAITSFKPDAITREKALVLETMVQMITVSTENSKLYDRSLRSVQKARQREESLAVMNSALLAISAVLNLSELLNKFVETAARLAGAEMCTFFQLSPNGEELVAQAIFDSTGKWREIARSQSQLQDEPQHNELIEMIRLPFQQQLLARTVDQSSFFYLDDTMVEELQQASGEGGKIFLNETHKHKLLMIPVRYQTEMVGILAVHTPSQDRNFRPKEVSTLLAISAQAASAIRNAQLFEEIRDANAELRRMDRLKDEFIVTASHELRTPLSAVSGYASLLKRQSARITSQQALRYATKIGDATQQLIALVSNMTDAAKIGAIDRKLELQAGPVQMLTAAQIAMAMISVNVEQKITMQIDPNLWVYCDAMHLRQVLTNLLDNAAKYSPPTGHITVTATATRLSDLPEKQQDYHKIANGEDDEIVLVHVCDEGDGIEMDEQEKIFEKFVRAPRSLTTPVRGSGLGLYICRRYIEAMGGRLWLEMSIPGEGSIFAFYLPRIEAPIITKEEDEMELEAEYLDS
jgi:signal transduction histidine kinase